MIEKEASVDEGLRLLLGDVHASRLRLRHLLHLHNPLTSLVILLLHHVLEIRDGLVKLSDAVLVRVRRLASLGRQ